MAVELNSLQRPLRKLGKSLKRFPKDPPAEDVHQLRTQARRMEAMVSALMLDRDGHARHLLKTVAALRRAAGEVRDMDVLIGNARSLAQGDLPEVDQACLKRLVDHLRAVRLKSASELQETVAEGRKAARRDLKQCLKRIKKIIEGGTPDRSKRVAPRKHANSSSPVDPAATALAFASELSRWPRLRADNIHPFRVKVKTLRYVVELVEEADDKFVSVLDEVKDRIGEWHDWHELRRIARKILDHPGECAVRRQIEETEKRKLKQALAAANAMRNHFLRADAARSLGKKPPSSDHTHSEAARGGEKLAG
jgi:CHAD domain-containing protein